MTQKSTIHIKWVRSGIGFTRRQRAAVRSLGLRRLHQVVEREDTPQNRGLVAFVPHLVEIVEGPAKPAAWSTIPEYVVHPKPAAPALPAAEVPEEAAEQTVVGAPSLAAVTSSPKEVEAPRSKPARAAKAEKPAKAATAKGKPAKASKEEAPAKKKAKPAEKTGKPTKKGKK